MRTLLLLTILASTLAVSGCADRGEGDAPRAKTVYAQRGLPLGTSAVEGFVVDEGLFPLGGAQVRIASLGLDLRTDAEGYFHAGPIEPGSYRVSAAKAGFEPHSLVAVAAEGETSLVVFVLRGIPVPETYQSVQLQRGFLACAVSIAPASLVQWDLVNGAMDLECGAPRVGGELAAHERPTAPVEAQDRSQRRWVLDEPDATWESAVMRTQWEAGHELVRQFATRVAVDGCTDDERTFGRPTGTSPIVHELPPEKVSAVLVRAEGTTCTLPGERCDAAFCVLTSRARPAPRDLGPPVLRAGAAFQQVFEQELTATFRVQEPLGGQTLK